MHINSYIGCSVDAVYVNVRLESESLRVCLIAVGRNRFRLDDEVEKGRQLLARECAAYCPESKSQFVRALQAVERAVAASRLSDGTFPIHSSIISEQYDDLLSTAVIAAVSFFALRFHL